MKDAKQGKKSKVKLFKKKKKSGGAIDEIINRLKEGYEQIDSANIKKFLDFPLSANTLKGLKENGYEVPTEIQRESIGFALQGLDILGAAKTGSGKTLAFLIPVLEHLYIKKWTRLDGVGALIITPTRELAYQIFEMLRKVGFYHDFSAGLIIGGKDLHFEKHRMHQINIVICTPGRLLQHMDENPLFDCVNMQILVLDEADRCLDMGFEQTMNSIIENLPPKHQTLLFSATQTKSVRDLARLSLKDPKYISVHEHAKHSTPEGLIQSYVVCELHDKMAMLWSFIKNHIKHKILVFLASCKQVKYTFEILCKLRPPTALLALHGSMHQLKRMDVYRAFSSKQNVVLFATDLAARGLDFPEVNWVVQLDCPEDANTYIHRAGRTARYQKGGESLLVLMPSERDAMLQHLQEKKIPISEIRINPAKLMNPQAKFEAFLAKDPNLKASAQRAFVAYLKSVFLMKDKSVFQIKSLNTDAFARSLGLIVSPRIRFLQRQQKSAQKNTLVEEEEEEFSSKQNGRGEVAILNSSGPKSKETFDFAGGDSESDEDDLLYVKQQDHNLEINSDDEENIEHVSNKQKKALTKAAVAKKLLKKKILPNQRILFTETGEAVENERKVRTTEEGRRYEKGNDAGINLTEARTVMKAEDKIDRKLFREKVKAKHKEKRIKEKKLKKKKESDEEDEGVAYSGSESDGSKPDLSWLPDPDKIYGPENSDVSNEEDNELEEEEELGDIPVHRPSVQKKRKSKEIVKNTSKKRRLYEEPESDEELGDTGLSLQEDQELALKLLSVK